MQYLYLAGRSDALIDAFYDVRGVEKITPGTANAREGLTFDGIELGYNPKKIDISDILVHYFEVANPYTVSENEDELAAVIYTSAEAMMQLQYYTSFLQNRGREPIASLSGVIINDSYREGEEMRPVTVRFGRLQEFTPLA